MRREQLPVLDILEKASKNLAKAKILELKKDIIDHSQHGITLAGVEQLIDQRIKELE